GAGLAVPADLPPRLGCVEGVGAHLLAVGFGGAAVGAGVGGRRGEPESGAIATADVAVARQVGGSHGRGPSVGSGVECPSHAFFEGDARGVVVEHPCRVADAVVDALGCVLPVLVGGLVAGGRGHGSGEVVEAGGAAPAEVDRSGDVGVEEGEGRTDEVADVNPVAGAVAAAPDLERVVAPSGPLDERGERVAGRLVFAVPGE